MELPAEFTDLFPKVSSEHADKPIYYLWVYDPLEDKVRVEHNEGKHRADKVDHGQLAESTPNPGRVHGYAYRIVGGFRITDWDHRPVADPHIKEAVADALKDGSGPDHSRRASSHSGSVSQLRALRQQ